MKLTPAEQRYEFEDGYQFTVTDYYDGNHEHPVMRERSSKRRYQEQLLYQNGVIRRSEEYSNSRSGTTLKRIVERSEDNQVTHVYSNHIKRDFTAKELQFVNIAAEVTSPHTVALQRRMIRSIDNNIWNRIAAPILGLFK